MVRPGTRHRTGYASSISPRCHPILAVFVWELTEETIDVPLGCLQGGFGLLYPQRDYEALLNQGVLPARFLKEVTSPAQPPLEQLLKLPALFKLTNTDPFAAWCVVTGNATPDGFASCGWFLEPLADEGEGGPPEPGRAPRQVPQRGYEPYPNPETLDSTPAATPRQILSQSPSEATRFWRYLYGS